MHTVLIVDDEPGIRQSLKGVLEDEGYKVHAVDSGEACLETLHKRTFDVVLLDIWLPGMDGLDTLEKIKAAGDGGGPEVVMISGHGTIETAVRATKLGAFDFLEKPLSLDRTLIVVKNAIDAKRLREENVELRRQQQAREAPPHQPGLALPIVAHQLGAEAQLGRRRHRRLGRLAVGADEPVLHLRRRAR